MKVTTSKLFEGESLSPSTVEEVVSMSEHGSVAYLVERATRETQAEQYPDTAQSSI